MISPASTPDVIVIGAGPGGYVAAIRMAQLGLSVTVVEKDMLGGVCLNWGCIPSKALIHAGSLYEEMQHAGEMGLHVEGVRVEMPKLVGWKDKIVKKLTGGIQHLLKSNGVTIVKGTARFKDAKTLLVTAVDGSETPLQAKQYLIATGSSPVQIPAFPFDGETIVDSTNALDFQAVPDRMAVIGGGVIGLELGVLYAKLGTQVTVIEMLPQILAGTDEEIVQVLAKCLKKRKVVVHTHARAQGVEKTATGTARLTFEPEGKAAQTIEVDKVLVAVGRTPNTKHLGLEAAGVALTDRGFIRVDAQCRTSVPHIFAIGDVVGGALLAHKASKEGTVVAEIIAGNTQEVLDVRAMPAAVFTDPEVATVGLTEAQAKEHGYDVRVGRFPFQASGRALSMNATDGLVKVVADAATDQILGVHMVGPHVSELIAEATLAIEVGATVEDLALTVHAHPTLPETLMEAAEDVHHRAIHIYQPQPKPQAALAK